MAGRSSAEPPAKMAKKEEVDEEFSDLLTQPREILIQIINHLDPLSLRELAYTCKDLFSFCLNTKGIEVVFPVKDVFLRSRNGSIDYDHSCHCGRHHNKWSDDVINPRRLTTGWNFQKYLKQLRKWPLAIHIDTLKCHDYGIFVPDTWENEKWGVKEFLERHRVKKIRCWSVPIRSTVEEVEHFTNECVKTFGIEEVQFGRDEYGIDEGVIVASLKMSVTRLQFEGVIDDIDADLLITCSIPVLDTDLYIKLEELDTIIQMWKTRDDLQSWKFRRNFNSSDLINHFSHCEMRHFKYKGPIDRSNPPVFMDSEDNGDQRPAISFYILRPDGRVLCVTIDPYSEEEDNYQPTITEFRMCPIDQGPLALRNL